ncbi:response regulator [Clostridium grantii]|uniref:Stage 0 sporulation protein A homolog n=1 Tax=Clostridium grantii DSM 8605 TaxID=1121316 RepID=A0A1M5T5S9_9CLOT|nr:response regulator [Clostridium grantii]SHH46099.1 Response regulator receiver domain-containing protein [Clostridium grantii DSM 8605]
MNDLILIIEDNDDDVLVIERGFKKGKIANPLKRFVNGKEALDFMESIQNKSIELILLDLNMEVMNGFDFLKIRKESEKLSKIPVVILTSSHRDEDIELAYSLGANAYVEKPIDPKEFIKIIMTIEEFWIVLAKKPLL